MTSAQYHIYACDPFGTRLADLSRFHRLSYARVVNGWSTATIQLPTDLNTQLLRIPDGRIEIWRNVGGREYLDGECTWLLKAAHYARDAAGLVTFEVEADHPLSLLDEPGRFVNAYAGTSGAEKSGAADDLLKEIVTECTAADSSARNISAYLSVAPDLSLGPDVEMAFAWRNVLSVLRDIADAAAQAGTYVAFDIVAPTPNTFEFRTYVGQRGVDHRSPGGQSPVILSPAFGNLTETDLLIDYRGEVTSANAGGQGEETARVIINARDNARIGASPFGWREVFVDATNTRNTTTLAAVAAAQVRAGRPRVVFAGKIVQTSDTLYGVHWGFGDYVTAEDFGYAFDCRIDAVSVNVEQAGDGAQVETVEAWLRAETVYGTSGNITTSETKVGRLTPGHIHT